MDAVLGGPARSDRLCASVELDALGPVNVVLAVQRILPAAKRVVGNRGWDWHVDADHASLNLVLETPGNPAVISKDSRAVADGLGIH